MFDIASIIFENSEELGRKGILGQAPRDKLFFITAPR